MRMLLACLLVFAMAPVLADCRPDRVRLVLIPKKSMESLIQDHQPLLQHLSEGLGRPVEIVSASSYEGVIDAIVSGGADLAWLGPASYLLAHQRDPRIEPFASLFIDKGHFTAAGQHYQSLLLARHEVRQLSELKGARVALTDPSSTSGSLIPNGEFPATVGVPLERFFAAQVYTGSHPHSLDALLDKRVDAAFVASESADDYLARGFIDKNTLRVLWRSAPIHYDPYVFRGGLCAELKAQIRQLMLSESAHLAVFFKSQQATGFAPVSHEHYQPLLRFMRPDKPD
jgi:phosphonate transport system substrate-binding protein